MTSELADDLLELLAIQSYSRNEDKLAAFVQEKITSCCTSIETPWLLSQVGSSLVLQFRSDAYTSSIGFAGHLDTVPGTWDGWHGVQDGDKIVGLGSTDMKGSLAVMLSLLTPEIIDQTAANLTFIFYTGEEGPFSDNGLHAVFEAHPELRELDFCFVMEPTENQLGYGCMGLFHAEVTFRGTRAHSARPWEGENAIFKAQGFIQTLSELEPRMQICEGFEYREVLVPTVAHTGETGRNVVPDEFMLDINCRFCPSTTLEEAKSWLESFVPDHADIRYVDEAPSGGVFRSAAPVQFLRERFSLSEFPYLAYTDVALFSSHGVPSVNFGPGVMTQMHQVGEYTLASQLTDSREMLVMFLQHGVER